MAKIRRTEKIRKKSVEEELKLEGEREVHGQFVVFPLIKHRKRR